MSKGIKPGDKLEPAAWGKLGDVLRDKYWRKQGIGMTDGNTEDLFKNVFSGMKVGIGAGPIGKEGGMKNPDEEWKAEKIKISQEFIEKNKDSWKKAGNKLCYPEKVEKWTAIVEESPKSEFGGFDIAEALEIMEALDITTDIEEVVALYGKKMKYTRSTINLILGFSKRGPEYVEHLMQVLEAELTPEMRAKLDAVKAENMLYARNELNRNLAEKNKSTTRLDKIKEQLAALTTGETEKVDQGHSIAD